MVLILQCSASEKARGVVPLLDTLERSSGHLQANGTIPVSKPVAAFLLKEMVFYFCKQINFHGSIGSITSGGGLL